VKYAVEMGSRCSCQLYIPSFMKFGSGIQKLIGGMSRLISLFFQNRENKLEVVKLTCTWQFTELLVRLKLLY
jgi:hypothetical protein